MHWFHVNVWFQSLRFMINTVHMYDWRGYYLFLDFLTLTFFVVMMYSFKIWCLMYSFVFDSFHRNGVWLTQISLFCYIGRSDSRDELLTLGDPVETFYLLEQAHKHRHTFTWLTYTCRLIPNHIIIIIIRINLMKSVCMD